MFAKFKKEIIDYLMNNYYYYCYQNIVYLAHCNRLDLIEIIFSETDVFIGIDKVIDHASLINGNLEMVKYLTGMGASCSTNAMNWAAKRGHLDIVQWLHFNRLEGCSTGAMNSAAEFGYLDIVQWLHFNRSEGCSTSAMDSASRNGHLDVVQWFHSNRSEGCTSCAMDLAAQNGHLDVVKWLHLNRSEGCSADAMIFAAQRGHINVVKYLVENSLVTDRDALRNAMDYAKAVRYTEIEIYLNSALIRL